MKAVNKRSKTPITLTAGVRMWLVKNLLFVVILAAVLLIAGGRVSWGMGWAYAGVLLAILAANVVVLVPNSPDLLEERSQMQAGTQAWDRWLSVLMAIVLPLVTLLVAGLDERFGWSGDFGLSTQVLALIPVLLGGLLATWAMSANKFFSGTARIQSERGQTVVRGGPYEYVRHPGYAGSLLYMLFTPLALGSWWAFIPAVIYAAVVVFRTYKEDEMLQDGLTGYKKYAKKVRFRLLPMVW